VTPAARAKGSRVFAIGHPASVQASDTFYSFHMFMNAYDVEIVDENGKLLLDQPKNKAGLTKALADYAAIVKKGCSPASSVNWGDVDNNLNFANKTTAMTHNATISIASKWLDDMNNDKLTAEQRVQQKQFELEQAVKDAEIEVARARGAAQSQEIVRSTLSDAYLQYLWIKTLSDNPNVIYVATEANLPLFKTTK